MSAYRKNNKGFTLVEILIVVIILGILAAIVIPQFTNASQDARKSSLTSQLQTVRSQVELYKLQHLDQAPPKLVAGGTTAWDDMTVQTNADHTTTVEAPATTLPFGPYLQAAPINPLNNSSSVFIVTSDVTLGGPSGATSEGWIYNTNNGKTWATSAKFTKVYNEGDPSDTNNDQ
jgi:general secretion pathway protein G